MRRSSDAGESALAEVKARVRSAQREAIIQPVPDSVRYKRIEQKRKQFLDDIEEHFAVVYRNLHVEKVQADSRARLHFLITPMGPFRC